MKWIIGRSQRFSEISHVLFVTFWCVIIVFFLTSSLAIVKENLSNDRRMSGPFDKESTDMFNFISSQTKPDSIIIFFKPRVMRMFTDRNSIVITKCTDLSQGSYYVYHKEMGEYSQVLLKDIAECNPPKKLEIKFDNDKFKVYKIVKNTLTGT